MILKKGTGCIVYHFQSALYFNIDLSLAELLIIFNLIFYFIVIFNGKLSERQSGIRIYLLFYIV